MNLVSFLFGFSGRINRLQYWLGYLGAGFGGAVLILVLGVLTMPAGGAPKTSADALLLLPSMGVTFGIPLMLMGWIGSALQTKRFHDRGRSGLWALAPFVPLTMIVITVISAAATNASIEHVLSSAGTWFGLLQLVNLFMFVDLGCMPSKPEPNKYGNPPGGGLSGGAPMGGAPTPGYSAPAKTQAIPGMGSPKPVPAMGSSLSNAESAIERAIAARSKQVQAAAQRPAAPARVGAQPAASLRPATPGTFGRKVTQ